MPPLDAVGCVQILRISMGRPTRGAEVKQAVEGARRETYQRSPHWQSDSEGRKKENNLEDERANSPYFFQHRGSSI